MDDKYKTTTRMDNEPKIVLDREIEENNQKEFHQGDIDIFFQQLIEVVSTNNVEEIISILQQIVSEITQNHPIFNHSFNSSPISQILFSLFQCLFELIQNKA